MSHAGHKVVVNPRQVVHGLGDSVDLGEILVGKNVAIFEFDTHRKNVGAAKAVLDAVVQFDIGMLLRQQVGEVGVDFQPGDTQGERQREDGDHAQYLARVVEDP